MSLTNCDFERILICASEANVSDIHFCADKCVYWRRYGDISPLREYVPSVEDMWRIFTGISSDEVREKYVDGYDDNFMWNLEQWRYRVHCCKSENKLSLLFHVVSRIIPELDTSLCHFTDLKKGLVIVAGRAGSGRSTLSASILNTYNSDSLKIVTIEDSVEYILPKSRALVMHRGKGIDFNSTAPAIAHTCYEDADVVFVSNPRCADDFREIVESAKDRLVIISINAASTVEAIENILSKFKYIERNEWAHNIGTVFMGAVAQELHKNYEGSLTPSREILLPTQAVINLIKKNDLEKIKNVMSSDNNMVLMDDSIKAIKNNIA